MPRLSFIVCAFENPSALRTCLSSLLDQTMQDFEIIVVDNSIDKFAAYRIECLCEELSFHIQYEWTSTRTVLVDPSCRHSRCLYTASEIGAKMATGDFLCFPNSDSYYPPVFAERMLRAAENGHCDLIYSDFVLGTPDRKYVVMESQPRQTKIDKTSFILRRELFAGFPDKANYEQADGMMIERLVVAGVSRRRVGEILCWHN